MQRTFAKHLLLSSVFAAAAMVVGGAALADSMPSKDTSKEVVGSGGAVSGHGVDAPDVDVTTGVGTPEASKEVQGSGGAISEENLTKDTHPGSMELHELTDTVPEGAPEGAPGTSKSVVGSGGSIAEEDLSKDKAPGVRLDSGKEKSPDLSSDHSARIESKMDTKIEGDVDTAMEAEAMKDDSVGGSDYSARIERDKDFKIEGDIDTALEAESMMNVPEGAGAKDKYMAYTGMDDSYGNLEKEGVSLEQFTTAIGAERESAEQAIRENIVPGDSKAYEKSGDRSGIETGFEEMDTGAGMTTRASEGELSELGLEETQEMDDDTYQDLKAKEYPEAGDKGEGSPDKSY